MIGYDVTGGGVLDSYLSQRGGGGGGGRELRREMKPLLWQ